MKETDAMRTVDRVERASLAREIRAAAIAGMAAAWILLATPALAQDARGMAQNGADRNAPAASGAAQEERMGVSRPNPAAIPVTPYSDDADSNTPGVGTATPAKPSAATPRAATNQKPTAAKIVTTGNEGDIASGKDAAAFDPDANIVTDETAGRADRILMSDTQSRAAKADPDAGIVTRVPSRPGEVPDGTLMRVKLREELSTLTTRAGTSFTAEVSEPVLRDAQVVVPVGALLEGRVTLVHGGKRVGGSAAIHLEPLTVTLPDGSRYLVRARVIDTDSWNDTKVDSEGTILRKDHAKGTAAMIGLSAGGAMAAGAEMGGVPGALIGAGVGAGISTVVWARQDRQATLPKDLSIVFCLTEPMRVTPLSAQLARPGAGIAGAE
jgi:hypothetical protein